MVSLKRGLFDDTEDNFHLLCMVYLELRKYNCGDFAGIFADMQHSYKRIVTNVNEDFRFKHLAAFRKDWEVVELLHEKEGPTTFDTDSIVSKVASFKYRGDRHMRRNEHRKALVCYSRGLRFIAEQGSSEYDLVASNISRKASIARALGNCPDWKMDEDIAFKTGDAFRAMFKFSESKGSYGGDASESGISEDDALEGGTWEDDVLEGEGTPEDDAMLETATRDSTLVSEGDQSEVAARQPSSSAANQWMSKRPFFSAANQGKVKRPRMRSYNLPKPQRLLPPIDESNSFESDGSTESEVS